MSLAKYIISLLLERRRAAGESQGSLYSACFMGRAVGRLTQLVHNFFIYKTSAKPNPNEVGCPSFTTEADNLIIYPLSETAAAAAFLHSRSSSTLTPSNDPGNGDGLQPFN